MTYRDLIREIRKGKVSPVYLFWVKEGYFVDKALDRLKSEILNPATLDFNLDVFSASKHDSQEIISRLNTLPYLSSWRLVVVKEGNKLFPRKIKSLKNYLHNPSTTTCLVVISEASQPLTKWRNFLAGKGKIVEFKPLYQGEISQWIKEESKTLGKEIEPEAISLLREKTGDDLQFLSLELQKLADFVGEKKAIKAEDVREITSGGKIYTLYNLIDAIIARDKGKSMAILNQLLKEGKQFPEIINSLAWQWRRLWRVKSRVEQGKNIYQAARSLKISTYFIGSLIKQMQKLSSPRLKKGLRALLDADIECKSGADPQLALELLIIRLCS